MTLHLEFLQTWLDRKRVALFFLSVTVTSSRLPAGFAAVASHQLQMVVGGFIEVLFSRL